MKISQQTTGLENVYKTKDETASTKSSTSMSGRSDIIVQIFDFVY